MKYESYYMTIFSMKVNDDVELQVKWTKAGANCLQEIEDCWQKLGDLELD